MRSVSLLAVALLWLALPLAAQMPPTTPAPAIRTWTTTDGRTFQAALVSVQGTQITVRTTAGQLAQIALLRLSLADQTFVRSQQPGAAGASAAAGRVPPEQRIWPVKVEVDSRAVEVATVSESPAKQKYVYRSRVFEFAAQDKLAGSVMKEVARTFEATFSLVQALPWGIDPKPPADLGFYQAKFYLSRANYLADGGPANSGGVYFSKDRVFRVPFESLGLEQRGKTWFKDSNYRADTVVHEITHQMMHDFLPFLPTWVIEGTAEYTSMLPLNAGAFAAGSHPRGIKDYLKNAADAQITPASLGPLLEHMRMPSADWQAQASGGGPAQRRLYVTSALLVYYFSHLDGDGKGLRFLRYMDKIAEARDAWATFFKDPRVQHSPDGSFRYPGDLPLPSQKMRDEYGLSQLDLLLDGRDAAKLQKDVSDAYKKIGVRW